MFSLKREQIGLDNNIGNSSFARLIMIIIIAIGIYWSWDCWGMCGALVESMPYVRRVMGSTPALAAT